MDLECVAPVPRQWIVLPNAHTIKTCSKNHIPFKISSTKHHWWFECCPKVWLKVILYYTCMYLLSEFGTTAKVCLLVETGCGTLCITVKHHAIKKYISSNPSVPLNESTACITCKSIFLWLVPVNMILCINKDMDIKQHTSLALSTVTFTQSTYMSILNEAVHGIPISSRC